jgi:hypothetical protein
MFEQLNMKKMEKIRQKPRDKSSISYISRLSVCFDKGKQKFPQNKKRYFLDKKVA